MSNLPVGTRDRIVNTDESGGGGGNVVITSPLPLPTLEQTGLIPEEYDFVDCGYTGSNMTQVIFKTGGAGGVTVATLAITYTGNLIDTVTRT